MSSAPKKISWKYALGPSLIMVVLAIYPQVSLWIAKGSSWHGSYVVSNYDETAYSAYVNALVHGKSRRNDPFIGVDDTGHESLYSIQFIPAYLIAAPARLFGISTSTVFILLSILLAVASSLALFWFIRMVTEDNLLSAAGTLVVLCLGTAVAFQGEISKLIEGRVLIDFFPFVRRYQPGIAFPLFFIFCGIMWRSTNDTDRRKSLIYAIIGGSIFAVLVFSYFYLWTAALTWIGCFGLITIICKKENKANVLVSVGIVAVFAIASLIQYSLMLGARSPNLDSVQLLSFTHAPDLTSPTELVGLLICVLATVFIYRGRLSMKQPQVLLAISLSITPVILFNQQVVTGRSLQPIHYEIFIANYMVLAAAVLVGGPLLLKSNGELRTHYRKTLAYVTTAAILWGVIESITSTAHNSVAADIRDESVSAIHLIEKREIGSTSVTRPVVLATNFVTSDIIPTFSTFRPLWNAHTSSAGGVGIAENKRLFYLYLFYSGYSEKDLTETLSSNSFEVTAAIFGSERALPSLAKGNTIRSDEIQSEGRKYSEFVRNFDTAQAGNPVINYLIVPAKAEPDYSNLDRWYQRDAGQDVGLFKVYGLTSKFAAQSKP